MNKLLMRAVLICVSLLALTNLGMASSLSDAANAYVAGNYGKAKDLLKPLAEDGDASAQWMFGHMYHDGNGVPQDYKEAVKWYRLAAEQGDALAQTDLGAMYLKGQGILQEYTEAAKEFRLAAEQGFGAAQWYLGTMYLSGKGVPQNFVLAHMWLNISTANADSKSQQEFIEIRNSLLQFMTAKQIAGAQELARKCTAQKFKGCE
jgi:TPR repeat protein